MVKIAGSKKLKRQMAPLCVESFGTQSMEMIKKEQIVSRLKKFKFFTNYNA